MRLAAAAALIAWSCAASGWWLDDRSREPHPLSMEVRKDYAGYAMLAIPLVFLAADYNDRAAHCIAGAAISTGFGAVFQPSDGWLVAVGIGALKEHADSHGGEWDDLDLAVTAGCAAVPAYLMTR